MRQFGSAWRRRGCLGVSLFIHRCDDVVLAILFVLRDP